MARPSRRIRILAACYGLYQAVHVPVNVRGLYLLGRRRDIDFPAPPPPGGWNGQVIDFFTGMASVDLVVALLSLVFVWGLFTARRWAPALGLVCLTASVYAAVLFDYATYAAGAWRGPALGAYLFINVAFLPAVWLYAELLRGALRGAAWAPLDPNRS